MKKLFTLLTMLIVAISTSWAEDITISPLLSQNKTSFYYGLFNISLSSTATSSGAKISSSAITTGTNGDVITIHFQTTKSDMYIKSVSFNNLKNGTLGSEDGPISDNTLNVTDNKNSVDVVLTSTSNAKGSVKITNVVVNTGTNSVETITFSSASSGTISFTSKKGGETVTSAISSITTNGTPSVSSNILNWPNGKTLVFTSTNDIKYLAFLTNDDKLSATSSPDTYANAVWTGTSKTITFTNNSGGGRYVKNVYIITEAASSDPSISASNVDIEYTAKADGSIAYSITNPVEGGELTAVNYSEADWLTVGTASADAVPFAATANTGAERSATVRLTYTYTDGTEKTITKDVTVTQAAATYAITYNKGAYGTGSIAAGEKSYGEDFTLSSSTFSREGYAQTGWATTDGGEKVYDLGGTYTANAAIELFPVWTASYTYTADFSGYTKGVPAGWAFSYDSTNKFATSNGNTSTTDFVGTMKDNGQTTPSTQASINDNWVAFGKKDGGNTNYAYAILDLGVTTTVYGMNATLYFGSSSNVTENIEYLGEDGTVKKTYNNTLSNTGWSANNISKTEAVADVRYIKVYGSNKWIIMSAFSVTTADETVLGAKVKTNGAGWTSFTPTQNATVATGAKAYIITAISGTSATTTEVTTMKAGEGYFIKGAANTEYVVTYTDANADDVTGSLLRGCLNATNLAANITPYNYVLGTQTVNEVKKAGLFYVKTNAVIVPSSKCYLASAILENPQNLSIEFDEATAVEAIAEANEANAEAPVKVIKNGKLFIGNYNVAGQLVK